VLRIGTNNKLKQKYHSLKGVTSMDKLQMKEKCIRFIDENKASIVDIGRKLYNNPELGYREVNSTKLVVNYLEELGLNVEKNIAVTGCRARVNEHKEGPKIAILGELDAILCKNHKDSNENGAIHACGHNIQVASMLGAVMCLVKSGVVEELDGKIDFMAVPAEEFIELEYRKELKKSGVINFFGGKQELISKGAFDDVDIAMMVHSLDLGEKKVLLDIESNGFIGKEITFIGKSSHAGACPENGINALSAAMLALNNINAQRETFRDEDWVRVHAIITNGGDIVNVVPSKAKMEAYVRARTVDSILSVNKKVNAAISAAGMTMGATVEIEDTFGYLPIVNDKKLISIFKDNLKYTGIKHEIVEHGKFTGSFDFGDVSYILPSIHPMIAGISGDLHTAEYKIIDEDTAYILPAKTMALTIIDLLYNKAEKAKDIIINFKPIMTKEEYIKFMEDYSKKYVYSY
jgi:amidohydrolase